MQEHDFVVAFSIYAESPEKARAWMEKVLDALLDLELVSAATITQPHVEED